MYFLLFFFCLFSTSCMEQAQKSQIKERNERKDVVHRLSYEKRYPEGKLCRLEREAYPWEAGYTGGRPPITKESFRCKGKHTHSLPLKQGEEFIYPILVNLLNHLQAKTGCPVVITCGHRCQEHHKLADPSVYNANSKHLMGAEVDFYLQGMENKEYETFLQLDPSKLNVSTPAWYNKEVLIKLYLPHEGRDVDNRHKYPYISIQVRYDVEKNEKVIYSKEKTQVRY